MNPQEFVPRTLAESTGVVVRQKSQKAEAIIQAIGLPFEISNKYRVNLLPVGKKAKTEPYDKEGWAPSSEEIEALESFLFVHEESDCFIRTILACLGWRNLRPLKMHFAVNGQTGDVYVADRPFRLGACCCCCPFTMNLNTASQNGAPGRHIGRVHENFTPYMKRLCQVCCTCTSYTDIDRAVGENQYETQYTIRTNMCCCGRVNNCCGGTCCKNDAVYDILDKKGDVVGYLQLTFAGSKNGCLSACCRTTFEYETFILEFPKDSTPEDRMLLLTGLFQIEYLNFEKQE